MILLILMNKGRDRLDDLNTEKQARLEMLSQNRKDLQIQAARMTITTIVFAITGTLGGGGGAGEGGGGGSRRPCLSIKR